jgi:hypothetical protein
MRPPFPLVCSVLVTSLPACSGPSPSPDLIASSDQAMDVQFGSLTFDDLRLTSLERRDPDAGEIPRAGD